ncbi:MAG: cell division protein ZapA [Pseudomonadota bacterium]
MAEVDVRIGERSFRLACDDGQELRLKALAEQFSARVSALQSVNDAIGDRQAVVVAALAILDEFDEAKTRWEGITPEGVAAEWAADRLDAASERLERALVR